MSLCRVGIRETIDPASPDWYRFRLGLVLSLDEIATAEANEEMISVCEDMLANSRLYERARKLPTINSVLAHAYAGSESGPPGENLRLAILHFRAAYESINREDEPVLHASFAVDMGLEYVRLGQDFEIPASELDAAIALVGNAVDTFSQCTCADLQVEAEWVLRRLTALARDGARFRAAWAELRTGKTLAERGEEAAAIAAFTTAIRLDAEQGEAYFRRGDLYENRGDYVRAVADYSEVIRVEPQIVEAYNNRGIAYQAQGKLEQAINDYSRALQLSPEDAIAFFNRGKAHRERGDLERAVSDYSEAIRLAPTLGAAFHNRGFAYDQLGRYDEAIADYTHALALNPKNARALNSRGVSYKRKGDIRRAFADYSEAMRLNSADDAPALNRGNLYLAEREFEKAIADYDEAIRIDPGLAAAYYGRGLAYLRSGQISRSHCRLFSGNCPSADRCRRLLRTRLCLRRHWPGRRGKRRLCARR